MNKSAEFGIFPEMIAQAKEIYETAMRQIAQSETLAFQKGMDRTILWQTINNLLNFYQVPAKERNLMQRRVIREIAMHHNSLAMKEREAIVEENRPMQYCLPLV